MRSARYAQCSFVKVFTFTASGAVSQMWRPARTNSFRCSGRSPSAKTSARLSCAWIMRLMSTTGCPILRGTPGQSSRKMSPQWCRNITLVGSLSPDGSDHPWGGFGP
ncbi:hypothetical protein DSP71_04845 [Microbacterium sp. H6]|nr:hypothetical protein DSP71_04845 [Microbacterium sp. H6]